MQRLIVSLMVAPLLTGCWAIPEGFDWVTGFDSPGGNFQVNTYGLGGVGNDDVQAQAQSSGNCNANFGTVTFGASPVIPVGILFQSATVAAGPQFGKVKEPVLRLTAFLRAFGVKSDSGVVLMTMTDDPGLTLAQTPDRKSVV